MSRRRTYFSHCMHQRLFHARSRYSSAFQILTHVHRPGEHVSRPAIPHSHQWGAASSNVLYYVEDETTLSRSPAPSPMFTSCLRERRGWAANPSLPTVRSRRKGSLQSRRYWGRQAGLVKPTSHISSKSSHAPQQAPVLLCSTRTLSLTTAHRSYGV